MFEKEAEEYCTRQELLEDVRDNICNAFEDGAEFGFNKANEWHYPSKGEYPKENQEVFVFFTLPDKSKNDIITAQFKDNDFNYVDLQDVIAWKEIVLPELPKESV